MSPHLCVLSLLNPLSTYPQPRLLPCNTTCVAFLHCRFSILRFLGCVIFLFINLWCLSPHSEEKLKSLQCPSAVFPSGEPGMSGDFWGSQEGCQGPSRPSGRTPSHGIQVFQLSPGSLGRCLRRGWGGRKGPRPSSTSFKRLPAGAVRGTEFHVCFCLNKGFLLTVRKSLQASKASSNPEQLLPSLQASNLNISAQQRRIPASLPCCQLADIYSITVSTRERNGLFS